MEPLEAIEPSSGMLLPEAIWLVTVFLLVALVILVFAFLVMIRFIRTNRLQREQLEIERAISDIAASLHEKATVEAILWDVAKNCIGRLKFEDCVIYMVDKPRGMLLQKAAWGPKTTEENKIVAPIEIPIGKGIVGSVAQTGVAEIVPDTSLDDRYIVDDAVRLSEISVPIIYGGTVLGIIDSEHPQRNFYTPSHLTILTTIAGVCANKIVRLHAESEAHNMKLNVLEHQRKTVEAQLKSLRLQMNPHFLFNSLNSIQQMILAHEDDSAMRYLSKFSRLLRLVLHHSDRETIMLKEEMETLQLYIELESLRFGNTFRYQLSCAEGIEPEEMNIPALMIQPFIENAIWHGLLHKNGDRQLTVDFNEDTTDHLICTIEDNGVGREAVTRNDKDIHRGKGIAVARERLQTYNKRHAQPCDITITDLVDGQGQPAGTRVTLILPLF